jgi:transcriptional regulator with XRE-family HTH domain
VEGLGNRLLYVRERAKLSRERFAARLAAHVETSVSSIRNYEIEEHEPSPSFLASVCREFGVNEAWLLNNIGDIGGAEIAEPGRTWRAPPPSSDFTTIPEAVMGMDGVVSIPFYGGDPGSAAGHHTYSVRMRVGKEWLASWSVVPLKAALFLTNDAALAPAIADGDVLLIDTSSTAIEDGIYLLKLGGALRVRRVQRRKDEHFAVIVETPEWKEEVATREELHQLALIGRVRVVFKKA